MGLMESSYLCQTPLGWILAVPPMSSMTLGKSLFFPLCLISESHSVYLIELW